MIFPQLTKYIEKIAKIEEPLRPETKHQLVDIVNFLGHIKDYIVDKNRLDTSSSSEEMKQEIDNIEYIISQILTPRILNILYSIIVNGIHSTVSTMTKSKAQWLPIVQGADIDNINIEEYVREILPKKAIKFYSQIYDDDLDLDRKISSSTGLYQPIIDIVNNIQEIDMTTFPKLISVLSTDIVKFMDSTYGIFIRYLSMAIYGYERYIINLYNVTRSLLSFV